MSGLKGKFKSPKCKVFHQYDVKDTLEKLHTDFGLVLTNKSSNNVVMLCQRYYIETLIKEIDINTMVIPDQPIFHVLTHSMRFERPMQTSLTL